MGVVGIIAALLAFEIGFTALVVYLGLQRKKSATGV